MNIHPKLKRGLFNVGIVALVVIFGITLWLAVRVKVIEQDFENIQDVPVVGPKLGPLLSSGAVFVAFYEHPHGGGWGIISGTCPEDTFRAIATEWDMKMFGKDVPSDLMNTFKKDLLNHLPGHLHDKVPVAEASIGGIEGQRRIGRREVRLNGFYFGKTRQFVLDVSYGEPHGPTQNSN